MAEQRRKSHAILLSVNSKRIPVELFPASEWPEQAAGPDLYRVRIRGRWHGPAGVDSRPYEFFSLEAVGGMIAKLLAEEGSASPAFPAGLDRRRQVRVWHGDCVAGVPVRSCVAWTLAPAHKGADGRYWVWVSMADGPVLVPADNVEILGR
jgi:hypothetical protein